MKLLEESRRNFFRIVVRVSKMGELNYQLISKFCCIMYFLGKSELSFDFRSFKYVRMCGITTHKFYDYYGFTTLDSHLSSQKLNLKPHPP